MVKNPWPFLAVNESLHGPLPCSRTDSCFVSYAYLLHKTKPPVPSLRLCPCPARLWLGLCWSLQCAVGPVSSQCLWGGFLLLQLLQGFCWSPEFSSFFPSWPLEESTFVGLLCWWECSEPQSQPVTHGFIIKGRIGNEERQENIYVEFFSLILWSWLNWE